MKVERSEQLFGALAALIAVVFLGAVVAVLVDGDEGVPAAGARATVDGVVLVVHADGSSEPLDTGDVVQAGEEVRVQSGSVVLDLASGATLEGREGRDDVDGTRVVIGTAPDLVAGDLLVRGRVPATIGAGGNDVTLEPPGGDDGAFRVRRGLSVTVGSYRGVAELDSAGQERTVPAYRQVSVASLGRPPASPDPLRLDPTDEWDLRYLGVAFELTRRLDALSNTYTANVGPRGATLPVLEALLPELADEPDFGPDLLNADGLSRPGGETLVGVSIALLGRGEGFAERFVEVRDFRDDGAEWGLVALDQDVAEGPLVATVEAAYGRAIQPVFEVAAPVAGGATITPSPASGPVGGAGSNGGGGTSTTTPSAPGTSPPGTSPPGTSPPGTEPSDLVTVPELPPLVPPPSDGSVLPDTGIPLLDDLVDPIDDLLGGILLGGILGG